MAEGVTVGMGDDIGASVAEGVGVAVGGGTGEGVAVGTGVGDGVGMEIGSDGVAVGEVGMSEAEKRYLKVADEFERQFINQGEYENRSIEKTLDIAWELFSILPEEELVRIHTEFIKKYSRSPE